MNLGKMLAEALREKAWSPGPGVGQSHIEDNIDDDSYIQGYFNLTTAAEAFLAKMREAEKTEGGDHAGPVTYYENVK
jgi:hypothetical protein